MSFKVALLSRLPQSADVDRFLFLVNGKRTIRYYGDRYTNEQAKNMLLKELKESSS